MTNKPLHDVGSAKPPPADPIAPAGPYARLRDLAEMLRDEAAVKNFNDLIRNGHEGIMDPFCSVIEALCDLSEEFIAWAETCDGDPQKCRARHLLKDVATMLAKPLPEHLRLEGEFETKLDVVTSFYLDSDDATCEMLCRVVSAIHDLREEIIAGAKRWGGA